MGRSMEQNGATPRAFGIREVCEATGLGRTSIYRAIAVGSLAARKFGRRTVILATDLDNFLNNLPAAREQPRKRPMDSH